MTDLELFATLQDGDGGLAQIFCDGHQHFYFERSDAGSVTRCYSGDPKDFHDYVYSLGTQGWRFAWAPQLQGANA